MKADALWRQCVKHRDGGRCRRCHKVVQGEAHHIVSRNVTATRWLLANGVYLCRDCHAAVHAADRDFGMTEALAGRRWMTVNKRRHAEASIKALKAALASGNFSDPDGVE